MISQRSGSTAPPLVSAYWLLLSTIIWERVLALCAATVLKPPLGSTGHPVSRVLTLSFLESVLTSVDPSRGLRMVEFRHSLTRVPLTCQSCPIPAQRPTHQMG